MLTYIKLGIYLYFYGNIIVRRNNMAPLHYIFLKSRIEKNSNITYTGRNHLIHDDFRKVHQKLKKKVILMIFSLDEHRRSYRALKVSQFPSKITIPCLTAFPTGP